MHIHTMQDTSEYTCHLFLSEHRQRLLGWEIKMTREKELEKSRDKKYRATRSMGATVRQGCNKLVVYVGGHGGGGGGFGKAVVVGQTLRREMVEGLRAAMGTQLNGEEQQGHMTLRNWHHWTSVEAVTLATGASAGMVVAESGNGCGGPLSVLAPCRSGRRLAVQLGPVCQGWVQTLPRGRTGRGRVQWRLLYCLAICSLAAFSFICRLKIWPCWWVTGSGEYCA